MSAASKHEKLNPVGKVVAIVASEPANAAVNFTQSWRLVKGPIASVIFTPYLDTRLQVVRGRLPGIGFFDKYFDITYYGRIWIEEPGVYGFSVASDDGGVLMIDGFTLIDNSGLHLLRSMTAGASMSRGWHNLVVNYNQLAPTGVALSLRIKPPNGDYRILDLRRYLPPGQASEPTGSQAH